jgi:acyl dehydratase
MIQTKVLTGEMRERVIATEFESTTFEVEKSHITAFARAIGDDNPLWNDEVAARRSRYGGLIAPPTFTRLIVNSLRLRGTTQYPLPGTVQLDGGSQWRYFEPIRPGDRITHYRKITDVYERQGSAGPLIFIIGHSRFVNQFDETAVTLTGVTIRYEPPQSGKIVRPAKPGNGRSAADTDTSNAPAIESLDWAGVAEGAEIGPFIKHTTTQDLVKYAGASGDFSEIHYDKDFALGVGLPGVILHGALKAAYLGKLMTDWLGDPGPLRSLQCQHRGMDFPSESVTCQGRVARKYVEDGQSLADCEISIENSSGQTTAPGQATISLPSS